MRLTFLLPFILISIISFANAKKDLYIAVSSNFYKPLQAIAEKYQKENSEVNIVLTSGSTGKITTSILYGAPFDLFFSADKEHIRLLEDKKMVQPHSKASYAVGKLYLLIKNGSCANYTDLIKKGDLRLSIANPKLAPYGKAAQQLLTNLKLWKKSRKNLVMGQNISQAYQWFLIGNAELALVSNSYLKMLPNDKTHKVCPMDEELYDSIEQQLVILKRTKNLNAAKLFSQYLIENKVAQKIIKEFGYSTKWHHDTN